MGSPVKYLFVSVVQHCTFVIMCGYFMESTQRIRFFCYLSSVKYQMTYIRSLVMNVAYARRKPPSGATPVRVHTLDRPVMYRSVMSLGLAGARMYGHKASRTKAPACLAHRLPHAGHPRHHARHIHTHTATACPASSPPIVRPRQRATAVVGPRQPPAVPLRLPWRTALRPSGSLVDCAACADRLGVPASKGRTLWAVSEAAALRHATEAVGHAKARGGGKDAGLEAARQRRCAQRVQHVQAHLRAEQG